MRPMVRWWWPGGDVTAGELRREVRTLDEAGFGGAEIQAFRIGLKTDVPADVAARVNDYPTPSFYGKVRAAAEEARDRGLFLDLTLGSGWPFGGGDVTTPELASIELRFTRKAISGLILPVDKKEIRERFAGLRIVIGDIPVDQVPARLKFGNAEFRFYFNDTDSAKEYAIGSASLELWDPHTGYVTPYKQDRLLLEPGQARLLLRK